MTLRLFEGPAGSGKTTRLFKVAAEYLRENALLPDHRVLALTKMHGSRRRMQAMLTKELGRTTLSECATLNSFVLSLVRRWRTLAGTLVDPLPPETSFVALAEVAAALLNNDAVVQWVSACHPLLIVDELQDLRGSELSVVKGLARGLDVLCAADEFQELDPQGVCEAVEWARATGKVVPQTTVHRTRVPALLAAARAIRDGRPPLKGSKFNIFSVPNPNVAASFMANNLTWWGASEVAVLSPVSPERSPFVCKALARLQEKPFVKDDQSVGPFQVLWEASGKVELTRWEELLRLDEDEDRTITADEIMSHAVVLPAPLLDWVTSRARLAGIHAFTTATIREQLGRAQSLIRAHAYPRRNSRVGLTVHQAKNKEFDRVIVLWPVEVRADADAQRRLLYNAITRAKFDCLVLIQDPVPNKSRLQHPPFA